VTDDGVRSPEREGFGPNAWLVDELYASYLVDPSSVPEPWRELFDRDRADGASSRSGRTARRESAAPSTVPPGATATPLVGIAATTAKRMDESLDVPTATSVRVVPAKLLELNRRLINRHLERILGGRVSFTHVIAFAIVRAIEAVPSMNRTYAVIDGRPSRLEHPHINLGLAVDVTREDGSRVLLVPNLKQAETLDFAEFVGAYDDAVGTAKQGRLSPDDLAGTTVTVTNPGVVGTVESVPRLLPGQSAIVGVGAIDYPAEVQGADPETLAELGVSKVVTLTSTYDHRVIQGAESGEFLGRVHALLLGEDDFYGHVFDALDIPYRPIHWAPDERPAPDSPAAREKQARVLRFIDNYRFRGHLIADINPLATVPPPTHPELDPANLGFTIWDLDRRFATDGLAGTREATLGEVWDVLRDAYTGTLAVEYMHIQEPVEKAWIQERVEERRETLSGDDRRRILDALTEAEAFERFLHTRYVGHKRFSLEGAESLIPILLAILDRAADDGLAEVVMGMAHRGRLNVLANVIGKRYSDIFAEFESQLDPTSVEGSGDVRYHLGAAGTHRSPGGKEIPLSLASNPSHLESVDPVVEGLARARQDLLRQPERVRVLPILIHGEAAFAGQGVVAETLALSQLPGYATGGTIHVIVNNQLGFTTPPEHGHSSLYASDVAKSVGAPILHVNGEDPEACVLAARLAFGFRQAFGKDVVVDMWCFRRWGHNEADEPLYTQPLMYRRIAELPSVRTRYTDTLVRREDLTAEAAEAALEAFSERLRRAFDETKEERPPVPPIERRTPPKSGEAAGPTGVPRERLQLVLDAITTVPEGFEVHPKLARWLAQRRGALEQDRVDWATAEALALGTVLLDGVTVRLTGQDTRRGTFSQRHAVLFDQRTGREHLVFRQIGERQGDAFVYDSPLSEFAAVGFEYGYSIGDPAALVLWEAQFGDFANGAQVIIDQYIATAEEKWAQASRLAMLLPHGYEGQGPEHSSARLERFLELAANDNLEVVVPSTPTQAFHLLRRQGLRDAGKPLVVMTPKSLLRARHAASRAEDLVSGAFEPVLGDPAAPAEPGRVVLCQGKLFYEIDAARTEQDNVALVRLERCYPFPTEELRRELAGAPRAELVWAQEEPENMGAARFVARNLRERLGLEVRVVARPESATTATGSLAQHQREQAELVDRALARRRVAA
jgi:2-oxoglutarate dehydrogenase E1 component